MQYFADIDLNGNQLKNVAIQVVTSDPATGVVGQVIYNSTEGVLKSFNGTSWSRVGGISAGNGITVGSDGKISISGLASAAEGKIFTVGAEGTLVFADDNYAHKIGTVAAGTVAQFTAAGDLASGSVSVESLKNKIEKIQLNGTDLTISSDKVVNVVLDDYYTKDEVDALPAVASGITADKVDDYDAHLDNGDIHVTAAQKTAWTAKQDALDTTQMAAVNSGINATKRAAYDVAVETSIPALQSDLGAAEDAIDALEDRMDAAEGEITGIKSAATALAARVSTNETDIAGLKTRMTTAESDIDAVEGRMSAAEADISELETGKADKADTYTKEEVDGKLAGTYHYRGTVASVSALPTTGQAEGDVWNVEAGGTINPGTAFETVISDGDNVAWVAATETAVGHWDKLAGTVDLSNYYTKAQVDAALDEKQDNLSDAQMAAANSGVTATKVSAYDEHVADSDIHVTAAQKTAWTAKQDALTTEQLAAVNSGITATKVSTYDGYATSKEDTLTGAKLAAVNSGINSDKVAAYDAYAASKADKSAFDAHVADTDNPHGVTAAQVGLGNVNNTSDLNKPISTATQAALDLKANVADVATHLVYVATGTLEAGETTVTVPVSGGNIFDVVCKMNGDVVFADVAVSATGATVSINKEAASDINVMVMYTKTAATL